MNKDNLLFGLFGLLLGFVASWLMFEKVTMLQPPRLVPGQEAPAGAQGAAPGTSAGPPAATMPGLGGPASLSGDLSELEELQRQVQKNPDNPEVILALAHKSHDIALQVPNPAGSRPLWQQAQEAYSRYIELRPNDPDLPDILSDMGVAYQELGDFDQALTLFRRARTMAPDHWRSLFNQVVVLAFGKKDFAAATKALEELKRVQPDNPDVRRLAAEVDKQRKAA